MNGSVFSLQGRKALVTGAGKGIGRAIASVLAQAGADVVAVSRTESDLRSLSQEIDAAGGSCKTCLADVTDRERMREIVAEYGPFRILVNNAGCARHQEVIETDEENYDFVMAVKTKAPYFLAGLVAKDLIKRKLSGSIINISSQMGHIGGLKRGVYCAANHAIEGYTKVMAWEWGKHGIRVNTVCPTFIETPMTKPMLDDEQFLTMVNSSIALGRTGKPEEIAWPVVFLASDASSLMTGSALMVDGGWTAK